jgi:hypothetical protein
MVEMTNVTTPASASSAELHLRKGHCVAISLAGSVAGLPVRSSCCVISL